MSKVLVIEDDKFLRELIVRKLSGEKELDIVDAADGETGLKVFEKEKPNLVLLDLILPGIDGFEVLSQIKQNPALSSIPVIILSNLGQKTDIDKGIKLGAIDYMVKAHFTPNEIVNKVKQVLEQK
ncbi:MAG: response regulator, partial [Parcubacteria group bacterium]|nr:response regulator [Parcubacteria group bacterium]